MNYSVEQIKSVVSALGEQTDPRSRDEYLGVKCPFHSDKNFGNAMIFLDTAIFKCFSCGEPASLVRYVAQVRSTDTKEAYKFIVDVTGVTYFLPYPLLDKEESPQSIEDHKSPTLLISNELMEEFDPAAVEYTRLRGFTYEYMRHFGIKRAVSGWYKGFMITPVPDAGTIEARKIYEREALESLLDVKDISLKRLRGLYKKWRSTSKPDDEKNKRVIYLDKPRVHYPEGSMRDKLVLFNESNLDFNQDLYFTEGLGSLPKIWTHISKNCTATFGSQVSDAQKETLNKFTQKKYMITDNDEASIQMAFKLCNEVTNLEAIVLDSTDTDDGYVAEIKSKAGMSASIYALRGMGLTTVSEFIEE